MLCTACGRRSPGGSLACPSCGEGGAGDEVTVLGPDLPGGMVPLDPRLSTTLVDRYRILSLLGRGGAGAVYRARDQMVGEDCAIKFLQPDVAADPHQVARFKRELLASRKVNHPNVIRLHDLGVSGRELFISMELLSGGSLAARLEKRPLPVQETCAIGAALARALGAVHEQGVVHRDLKPENVLFDGKGKPKLVDFGLAR